MVHHWPKELLIWHSNQLPVLNNNIQLASVLLISSYGTPLAQGASYLAQHSSLFGPDGTVNYDYIVTNSIKSLLIGSKYITNGTHTNHC